MNDASNDFMLIGLHKLAAERGDGLLPELLALYSRRDAGAGEMPNLSATASDGSSVKAAGNDNVIPLQPYLQARKRR